jgi:hypothetical protein
MAPRQGPLLALVLSLAFLGVWTSAAAAAAPQPAQVVAEEAEEHAEEAEEQAEEAEEATVSPFALAAPGVPVAHPKLIDAIQGDIKYLKRFIVHYRESMRFTRTLPHTTVRWLVHLPKKRQHVKELRHRIHELKLRQRELEHG